MNIINSDAADGSGAHNLVSGRKQSYFQVIYGGPRGDGGLDASLKGTSIVITK